MDTIRTQLRESLTALTGDLDQFDTLKLDVQDRLEDFVNAVVEAYILNPELDIHELLLSGLPKDQFDRLYPLISKVFLQTSLKRTDKFALFNRNELLIIDSATGNVTGRLSNLGDGTFTQERANQGIGTYLNNKLLFVTNSNPDSSNHYITQVDVDTMEVEASIDTGQSDTLTAMGYGNNFYFSAGTSLYHCNLDDQTIRDIRLSSTVQANINLTPAPNNGVFVSRGDRRNDRLYYIQIDTGNSYIIHNTSGISRFLRNPQMIDDKQFIFSYQQLLELRTFNDDYTDASRVQFINAGTNAIGIVDNEGFIYSVDGNTLRKLTSDLTTIVASANIGVNCYNGHYSDDNFLYLNDNDTLLKVDPNDLSIVWSKDRIEDYNFASADIISGTIPLRPSGGIAFNETL